MIKKGQTWKLDELAKNKAKKAYAAALKASDIATKERGGNDQE